MVAALFFPGADGVPVAWNKRKTLDAARKYAQKGAEEKALKEYAQLLQSDPKDAKLRIEVGDSYRRWGRIDEAAETYIKVAQQYTQEGFDARAVAVYKQIQALDAQRAAIYEPLAELYQRMGLSAEAVQALQTAAEVHQKAGRKREALGVLRKLTGLDPANTASRIKVAELLRHEGMTSEAVSEYSAVADELERQRDQEGFAKCLQRLIELAPERSDMLARLSRCLHELGRSGEAENVARRALAANPADPALYELLADLYRRLGRPGDVAETYRSLANFHRERGDTDRARDIMQRLISPDAGTAIDAEASGEFSELRLEEAAGVAEGDPSVFGSPSAFDADSGQDDEPLLLVEPSLSEAADDLFDGELGEDSLLEGDDADAATQLPAPLRRGGEAARRPAGEASADLEQLLAEASVYLRYGKRRQALENLEKILSLRPDHRPALEKYGEAQVEAGETTAAIASWQRALALAQASGEHDAACVLRDRIRALGGNSAEPGAGLADLPASRSAEPLDDTPVEEELYLDLDLDEPAVAPAEASDDFPGLEDPVEFEADLPPFGDSPAEVSAFADAVAEPGPAEAPAAEHSAASASQSQTQQILEDLEEADFYLKQGLLDESEAIFQRLARIAPNHPRVLVRLGEIAAARGQDPDSTASRIAAAGAEAPPPALSEDSIEELIGGEFEVELEAEAEAEAAAAFEVAVDVEEEAEARAGDFDLAAVLTDAFAAPEPHADAAIARAGDTTGEGFRAVFEAFKQGVSEALSEGDYEAHYDLGIAYREMGLYADALREFEQVAGSPLRRVDGLHMMGVCALDLGRPAEAIQSLQRALAVSGIRGEQELALRFELGRGFEVLGDVGRAREAWEAVVALDPLFCDVQERLVRLDQGEKPESAPPAAGVDDTAELPGAAGYESFDDLMASLADDPPPEAVSVADPPPVPIEPAAPAEADPNDSSPGKRRRRRIAFV